MKSFFENYFNIVMENCPFNFHISRFSVYIKKNLYQYFVNYWIKLSRFNHWDITARCDLLFVNYSFNYLNHRKVAIFHILHFHFDIIFLGTAFNSSFYLLDLCLHFYITESHFGFLYFLHFLSFHCLDNTFHLHNNLLYFEKNYQHLNNYLNNFQCFHGNHLIIRFHCWIYNKY